MKTTIELEKEIEEWDILIKTWNNDKLDDNVRKKAENEVHRITDSGGGELILEPLLNQTNEIIKMIEELTETLMGRNDEMHDKTGISMDLSELQEILKELRGENGK